MTRPARRVAGSLALVALALAAALVAIGPGCGDRVQGNLTGVDVHVTFDSALAVSRLRFTGWIGQSAQVPPEVRPSQDRSLQPSGENLIILLDDSRDGSDLFIRVDGLDRGGNVVGSTGGTVTISRNHILTLELTMAGPAVCGDGAVHAQAEECDDGNSDSGDGCSSDCVVEDGWQCDDAQPTVCRTCGDGICSTGEDLCSCPADCTTASCGDGLCCDAAGEQCSCPEDCSDRCGDGVCCPDEETSCTGPTGDCGACGDGLCDTGRGEDSCRCPQDCATQTGTCGNGSCCGTETAGSCPQDCCANPVCGDGTCCPGESAGSCPGDCCAQPVCGDGACCPGESCPVDCGGGGGDGGPGLPDAGLPIGDGGVSLGDGGLAR